MIFIAPKNFKRGRLIANKYTVIDLIIAISGVIISLIFEVMFLIGMLSVDIAKNLFLAILFLIPAGISVLFVVPNGVYHNIFTFIVLSIMEMFSHKSYIWSGIYNVSNKKQS